jgi:hypothetical protein
LRTPNLATIYYAPGEPPTDPAQLQRFLHDELLKIGAAIQALAAGHLDATHVAPVKPRAGDIRFADGTHWAPGGAGSRGLWMYNGTAWSIIRAI